MAEETPAAPAVETPVAETPKPATPPTSESKANGSETALLEKISRLEGDLHKERQKSKGVVEENATLKQSVAKFDLDTKKRGALEKAYAELGSDFIVEDEKRQANSLIVDKLGDSEDLDVVVKALVENSKSSAKPAPPVSPFGRPEANQPGSSQASAPGSSLHDMAKLGASDPAAFAAEMERQRQESARRFLG